MYLTFSFYFNTSLSDIVTPCFAASQLMPLRTTMSLAVMLHLYLLEQGQFRWAKHFLENPCISLTYAAAPSLQRPRSGW